MLDIYPTVKIANTTLIAMSTKIVNNRIDILVNIDRIVFVIPRYNTKKANITAAYRINYHESEAR